VAAELVQGAAPVGGCAAAAKREFSLTALNEPPVEPGVSLNATVENLDVVAQRATLELSFTFFTTSRKPGITTIAFHHAGPIKLDLEEVGGAWRVSSRARLETVPGCHLAKPRRCPRSARVLRFSVGEREPAQPDEELLSPVVPNRDAPKQRAVEAGRVELARSGCLACHRIGDNGNRGPGPNLTHVGSKLSAQEIARALVNPRPPMPSFRDLPAQKFEDIVRFLAALR
jgi:hypothetical protein